MMKKIGMAAAVLALCGASYALGYFGGGNTTRFSADKRRGVLGGGAGLSLTSA